MDWNTKTPSEWDWENLAMFGGKTIENGCFSGSDLGYRSSSKSCISASADSSLKEGVKTFSTVDGGVPKDYRWKEEFSGMDNHGNASTLGASVNCCDPMIGLKLGRQTYFEEASFSAVPSSSSTAATPKRSRASYHSTQAPRCQVEGCNLDLKSAKDYHRRHRICETHSKSPRVVVAGMERRFCQQCSRFHDLSEFDDKKRSCRRRLSDHNARRRRPRPEAMQFNSVRASSLYDGRHQMNFLLNRVPTPVSHHTWQNGGNFKIAQRRDSLSRPEKPAGFDRQTHLLCSDELPNSISFETTTPRVINHDLRRALSLLSTNSSWGLNEPEVPTSLGHFAQVYQGSMAQPMMPQNAQRASSQYMQVEQPSSMSTSMHSLDLHCNGNSQFQEFQFFNKAPYESGCFYPNQINQ